MYSSLSCVIHCQRVVDMKTVRENPEYAAMMRRMLAAWTRRAADGDPSDLTDLLAATKLLDDGIRAAVTGQRATYGTSWAAIGAAAGITRQAAQQRWSTPLVNAGTDCATVVADGPFGG